jgi:hypothetical protein
VGVLILVIGVGIFGTFTGYLANLFLSPPALMAQQQAQVGEIERLLRERED